ncbi:ABC transporter permease [Deinococcus sp. Leaf326]|jgi:ribose transport system permease protein|uniref:ABC transporter permease n=1 Tax=Deinococcus sp. Leaf326 TaxID=1736338 RepID=UPI0006FF7C0F|nr:ribose ABC transporter permease [Deinococcus sp. Leaf326]KQR22828.1 ribose ABC transporter permease [Deinococcus sp. Leaf326]
MSLVQASPNPVRLTLSRYGLWFIFAALVIVASLLSDRFLTGGNLLNIARQTSVNALLAFGMTAVILTAGIDLSVGSIVAVVGVGAALLDHAGLPFGLTALIVLVAGGVIGALNGLVVAYGRIAPFVVTLAALTIWRGVTLVMTDGTPVSGLSSTFQAFGNTDWLGLPSTAIVALIALGITWFALRRTAWGRGIYALGSSEDAARFAGLGVEKLKVTVYAFSGLLSAVAALLLTSRLYSAQPTAGSGFELDAIAAVVVGGTSLSGGRGTVIGTLLGALIIGVLNNAMNLLDVNAFYQQIVKGGVILGALLLERLLNRN